MTNSGVEVKARRGTRFGFAPREVTALIVHIVLWTFTSCVPLSAEDVPMKNGSVLKGEVLAAHEDPVKIRTEHGIILAPKNEIDPAWLAAREPAPIAAPAPSPVEPSLPAEARIQILEAKIATLEATIAALRAELKLAELEKASPKSKTDPAQKSAQSLALTAPVPPPSATSSVPGQGGYWLSTASGIRHNRECRYYMKSKGQPCLQNEGKPCTKCGG